MMKLRGLECVSEDRKGCQNYGHNAPHKSTILEADDSTSDSPVTIGVAAAVTNDALRGGDLLLALPP